VRRGGSSPPYDPSNGSCYWYECTSFLLQMKPLPVALSMTSRNDAVHLMLQEFPSCTVTVWFEGRQYLADTLDHEPARAWVHCRKVRKGNGWINIRRMPQRKIWVPMSDIGFVGRYLLAVFRETIKNGKLPRAMIDESSARFRM